MVDVKKANHAWSKFFNARSYIWTEYGKIRTRKKSAFGHISQSDDSVICPFSLIITTISRVRRFYPGQQKYIKSCEIK